VVVEDTCDHGKTLTKVKEKETKSRPATRVMKRSMRCNKVSGGQKASGQTSGSKRRECLKRYEGHERGKYHLLVVELNALVLGILHEHTHVALQRHLVQRQSNPGPTPSNVSLDDFDLLDLTP
jgi:hypothetical protein